MVRKTEITLSEKELMILTDIILAASAASGRYQIMLPCRDSLDENEVRAVKPMLDLFKLVENGNSEAVGRITGENGASVIASYKLPGIDKNYTSEDIYTLKNRLQAFLKEIAAENKCRPRTLYISDCHFYHSRICREMDKRGFSDCEEMNEYMIEQWNAKVTQKDDVFILGDFCIAKTAATESILKRLNGKLHMIIGNHDKFLNDKLFDKNRWFKSVESYQESVIIEDW